MAGLERSSLVCSDALCFSAFTLGNPQSLFLHIILVNYEDFLLFEKRPFIFTTLNKDQHHLGKKLPEKGSIKLYA